MMSARAIVVRDFFPGITVTLQQHMENARLVYVVGSVIIAAGRREFKHSTPLDGAFDQLPCALDFHRTDLKVATVICAALHALLMRRENFDAIGEAVVATALPPVVAALYTHGQVILHSACEVIARMALRCSSREMDHVFSGAGVAAILHSDEGHGQKFARFTLWSIYNRGLDVGAKAAIAAVVAAAGWLPLSDADEHNARYFGDANLCVFAGIQFKVDGGPLRPWAT